MESVKFIDIHYTISFSSFCLLLFHSFNSLEENASFFLWARDLNFSTFQFLPKRETLLIVKKTKDEGKEILYGFIRNQDHYHHFLQQKNVHVSIQVFFHNETGFPLSKNDLCISSLSWSFARMKNKRKFPFHSCHYQQSFDFDFIEFSKSIWKDVDYIISMKISL